MHTVPESSEARTAKIITTFPCEYHLKEKLHVLGIDDSPFTRKERQSVLVAVLMSHDFHIDGIMTRKITVDGNDAEDAILEFLETGMGKAANAVLTNGVTFSGFNIYSPLSVYRRTGKPVISIARRGPDIESMVSAIDKHERDPEKISLLRSMMPQKIELRSGSRVYVNTAGIQLNDARKLIEMTTFRGNIPEAVRIAHMIGTVIKRGRTLGRV